MHLFVNEVISLEDVFNEYDRCVSNKENLEEEITKMYEEVEEEIKKHETREEKLFQQNERLQNWKGTMI